ncbi:YqcI/YcgG family protein, partial [Xenorhabdus bovienii]|uniref:YqcI/YcgG family protein n=1 Tax=Xenorhabdus bovienii TaxID=40576 RepID=UPI0023B2B746
FIKTSNIEKELCDIKTDLANFFKNAQKNKHDGLLLIFEDESLGNTLNNLSHFTHRFILALSKIFPSVYVQNNPKKESAWFPSIEGEFFFVVSFAPCYPKSSPRYTWGDPRTFVMLQPGSTFERNTVIIEKLRKSIQAKFQIEGRP